MTDKPKRAATADRQWIDENGKEVGPGEESKATGFRYIHLATKEAFELQFGNPGTLETMLSIFGGLTLAGNVVNTWNGAKPDQRPATAIEAVKERFADLDKGIWIDREGGGGFGQRYDADALAMAIAMAKGESDPKPYLAKLADKSVKYELGKRQVLYGTFAMANPVVAKHYIDLAPKAAKPEAALTAL